MTSVPAKIRSNLLDQQVQLHRYEAGLRKDIVDMLQELGQDLIKDLLGAGLDTPRTDWQRSRLQALLSEVKDKIDEAYGTISTTHADELQGVVQISADGAVSAVNSALGADLMIAPKLSSSFLKKLVDGTLIEGAPSADWWSRQADDLMQGFTDAVRQGMLRGESIMQIRDRIMGQDIPGVGAVGKVDLRKVPMQGRGPIWAARRNAEALVRTSVITAANAGHEEAYAANADILESLSWCATLDPRTCPSCGALDGVSWKMGEAHPSPSLHWGCRCILIPETKSWETLAREAHGNSRIAKVLDQMPKGTRASMGGQLDAGLTYEDWLKSLPDSRQKEILGEAKWKLFQAGKIGLTDMVDQSYNTLTLRELEASLRK